MRLEKCWFCSSTVYPGHGIQFVRNDAKIFRFCRSKCHKNFKMKRNPRKVKWTKAYRRLHGKDMTQDSTFEFERKRNRPERYDRNLAENTLKAIKKIDKVRVDREARHHAMRMKGKKSKEQKEGRKELEHDISMLKAPGVLREDNSFTIPKQQVEVPHQQYEEAIAMEEMEGKKSKEQKEGREEPEQSINIIKAPPSVPREDKSFTLPKQQVKVTHKKSEETDDKKE